MTFEKLTRDIYLGADLAKDSKAIASYYKNSKYVFSESSKEGYTTYPSLAALGGENSPSRLAFKFSKHPTVNLKFTKGEILIILRKNGDEIITGLPFLKLTFQNYSDLDAGFLYLTSLYKGLASEKKIDANISEFSANHGTFNKVVTISKGPGDSISNGPVILVSLRDYVN